MKRITIERYDNPDELGYSGLVEGTRDDGSTWIMWLDAAGSPEVFWGRRDELGGVEGEAVMLT